MKVLAIDTAGWVASCALWEDGREIATGEKNRDKGQASLLPQLVQEVMGDSKIDHIIVNVGPGSFTGIRLGLAFAKGLALGWGVPLKGMDGFITTYLSLEPLDDVLILIEARRQDVYARRFQKGIPQETASLTRKDIEGILSSSSSLSLAGSGVNALLEGLTYTHVQSPLRGAHSLAHAFFTASKLAIDPTPYYVREADVSIQVDTCLSHP